MVDAEKIRKAFQDLADFIKMTVNSRVKEYGANRKGVNTLINSDLINNMSVITTDNSVELTIADYWTYISTGWKFNNFKSEKKGLFNALVQWALKKVTADNEEAYKLASALWYAMIVGVGETKIHRTIPGRPFMIYDKDGDLTKMIPELNDYIDKWFYDLFNLIITDIDNFFK